MVTYLRAIGRPLAWRGAVLTAGFVLLLLAPLVLPEFRLNLLAKFLTFAIVAVGLDLIWGYGGMLSLGQGLFFGLGAYAMAMYLKLEASGSSLPDFMVWSGVEQLPLFWIPFRSPVFAIVAALAIPALVATLLGFLVFRSRIQGVYFSIITQASTLIVSILFIGQQAVTGGTNGITDLGTIFGWSRASRPVQLTLYFVTVASLAAVYLLCRRVVGSRFGRLLVAMRDHEARVRFLGYDPVIIKTMVFALSAAIAGLGGALFVAQVGIISPAMMAVVPSVEMVIWVAVGGRGTLVGAIIGALLVNWGRSLFSESFPDIWQYFFGGLFIAAVLVFPQGIVGLFRTGSWRPRLRRKAPAAVAEIGGLDVGEA